MSTTLLAFNPPLTELRTWDATKAPRGVWRPVVANLDPKYGGMSTAVPALAEAISDASEFSTGLTGFCATGEHFQPGVSAAVRVQHSPLSRGRWLLESASRRAFREVVRKADGLHIHGLWEHSTAVAAHAARSLRKPYVISAHGMLQPWALDQKKVKKAVYAALIERANLRAAGCLHALTQTEADEYRHFKLRNPVAVIPNGVAVPANSTSEIFLNRFPELRDKRLLLFLARIHPKKGLDILFRAWERVSRRFPEAHLVVAGPDSGNCRAGFEALLATAGIAERVTFTGMLSGDLKWSALRAAEGFVLPSYSEGLSVSVLEAMGMGLPVVITRQCNLPEVSECNCGWVIEPQAGQLESALGDLLDAQSSQKSEIAANCRRLVATRYSWQRVAQQMGSVYGWLQGGAMPAEVEIR